MESYGLGYPFRLSVKGGLKMTRGKDKINECIANLLTTRKNENVMEGQLDSLHTDYIFKKFDESLKSLFRFEVYELLCMREPRIYVEEDWIKINQIDCEDGTVKTYVEVRYKYLEDDTYNTFSMNIN